MRTAEQGKRGIGEECGFLSSHLPENTYDSVNEPKNHRLDGLLWPSTLVQVPDVHRKVLTLSLLYMRTTGPAQFDSRK